MVGVSFVYRLSWLCAAPLIRLVYSTLSIYSLPPPIPPTAPPLLLVRPHLHVRTLKDNFL